MRGADTEPPICWKPCPERESQARGARSNSLPSAFQLCSASARGRMHFLRPVYSCCIGNFIAIPIMITGAESKESKMPLQGEITLDSAIYTWFCQAGVTPNPPALISPWEGDGGLTPGLPEPHREQSPPSIAARISEGAGWVSGGEGFQLRRPHISSGLEMAASGDIWSETRWRRSPALQLRGISCGCGTRRASPSPCAAPKRLPKVRSPRGGRGRGRRGRIA